MLAAVLFLIVLLTSPHPSKKNLAFVVEETKVIRYNSYTLIRTDLAAVQQACGLTGGIDDNGLVRKEPPACCYDSARKEVWVAFYHEACIPHELCHAEGRKDCAKVTF